MPDATRHTRGSHHSHKKQLLGNQNAKEPAPAWKNPGNVKKPDSTSKILLSNLPADVGAHDIVELFAKTIGPVKDCFLVYDQSGRKMGMAIVVFQRPGDAMVARTKYDGLIIDSKARINVEIITRHMKTPPPPKPTKLIERISVADPKTPQPPKARTIVPLDPTARRRVRKGAKRVNKLAAMAHKSLADLDKEIDEYKAALNQ